MRRFKTRGRHAALGALSAAALVLTVAASPTAPALAGPDDARVATPRAQGFDPAVFADPPSDSRPMMYWYWTGTVTPAVVDAQMAEMRDKGIHEAVLFPYGGDGMKPAYFTQGWFDIVEHVLREAQRTGMRIWLFNDSNFPSGKAGGIIANGGTIGDKSVEPSPELRLKALQRSTRVVEGPTTIDPAESGGLSVADGRLVVDAAIRQGAHPIIAGHDWADYTVTGKVRLTASGAQLAVRSSEDGTSGYLVDVDIKGRASVWRLDHGTRTRLTTGIPAPGFHPRNEQTITVTVSGDRIQPVINKTVQPVAVDTTYPTGAPAVSAEYGGVGVQDAVEGLQRVTWDGLVVTAPDGQQLWSRTFDTGDQVDGFGGPLVRIDGAVAAAARPVGSTDAGDLVELTPDLETGGWHVPAGRWQVDTYGKAVLTDDSSGYHRGYLDLLDPVATDRLFDTAQGEYVRRFGWAMGTVVPGFWDDEPFISSAEPWPFKRLPWSSSLENLIEQAGSTPGVAYTAAFEQLGRTGEQYSGAYWRAVNDAFATNYYQRQAEWMGQRGLQLITNPLLDETSPQQRMNSTGDLAKDNQYAQVPGTDMITGDYVPGQQTTLGRNAASSAHLSGAERALSEVFGNSGWGVAPEFMHATIGALATRGVNSFALHAMWTDENQVYFAPPFGPSSTFWDAMGDVDAWIGRVSELARGDSAAHTALLQPQRAAEQTRTSDAAHQLDKDLSSTAYALERGQIDYDLVSDGAFSGDPHTRFHAQPGHGELQVGQASYQMVVVPRTSILDLETVETLQQFVRTGGRVVLVGPLPVHEARGRDTRLAAGLDALFTGATDGWTRHAAGRVAVVSDTDALGALAQEAGVAAARLTPAVPAIRVLRTTRGNDTAFLINNESSQSVSTRATLPIDGVPEVWDPRTGDAEVATTYDEDGHGATSVPLDLDPYETLAVVFHKGTTAGPHLVGDGVAESVTAVRNTLGARVVVEQPGTVDLRGQAHGRTYRGTATVSDLLRPIVLDGPWTLQLERGGESPQPTVLGSWTRTDPTFSGSGVYRTSVDLTKQDLADRRLVLDLGEVHDIAQVTVNGVTLPRALWSPYTVDVTDALRAGDNAIEVRVTNTLLNKRSKTPPPSGLLGPVALRPQAVVDVTLR
ncbi:glycosyl hydrolase [Nocardioides sp. CER19]|uniref:glycosylhydrolase-like jelly roll fold domain-containing protein n=1 Tax=Nocardioides sp. CER19 TaxID=3038538 RepID=UPI00244C5D74|nr:glycosyl hydrolase [Nocardioides sp. CER19]MDH2414399.1 glycosyl hydrolase [Nocardioides sp. CER19]